MRFWKLCVERIYASSFLRLRRKNASKIIKKVKNFKSNFSKTGELLVCKWLLRKIGKVVHFFKNLTKKCFAISWKSAAWKANWSEIGSESARQSLFVKEWSSQVLIEKLAPESVNHKKLFIPLNCGKIYQIQENFQISGKFWLGIKSFLF